MSCVRFKVWVSSEGLFEPDLLVIGETVGMSQNPRGNPAALSAPSVWTLVPHLSCGTDEGNRGQSVTAAIPQRLNFSVKCSNEGVSVVEPFAQVRGKLIQQSGAPGPRYAQQLSTLLAY